MGKHRTRSVVRKARSGSANPASTGRLSLRGLLLEARASLMEIFLRVGFATLAQMLEQDREARCGPKHKPNPERRAFRHGHDEGSVVLGGRRLRVRKPRARTKDSKEIVLPTWAAVTQEDPLDARILEQMVLGVSARRYGRSLEELPDTIEVAGVSRTTVSRRFVARTTAQVRAFLSRPLGELDLPVVMLDGTGLGDHIVLIALGIDATGRKQVLGAAEGSTESEQVCQRLLRTLVERGLAVERARLFVIDGGKGIRKAVRATFGDWALIQRCQEHKRRNVAAHLPEHRRSWVRAAMKRAWAAGSPSAARRKLLDLAQQLEVDHPGAASSIREGLEETLTLARLGVSGRLQETLRSTNPIENLQGTLKRVSRNVTRWRGGSMALRWAVTGLLEAEGRFRRVKGCREMPALMAALERYVPAAQQTPAVEVA